MDNTELIILDEEKIKCKYCYEDKLEKDNYYVYPCMCTEPVCKICLEKKISVYKTLFCELCLENYDIPDDVKIVITDESEDENNTIHHENRFFDIVVLVFCIISVLLLLTMIFLMFIK